MFETVYNPINPSASQPQPQPQITKYLHRGTFDEDLLLSLEFEEDLKEECKRMENLLEVERKLRSETELKKAEAEKQKAEAGKREADSRKKLSRMIKKMLARGVYIAEIAEEM